MQRSYRPPREILPRIGKSQPCVPVEPRLACDQHRLGGIRGIAKVGERKRRRTLAANQQLCLVIGIDEIEELGGRRFNR